MPERLTGTLSPRASLTGTLSPKASLSGSLTIPSISVYGEKDYEKLFNHPQIESNVLIGNKTFEELGLSELSGDDLINILSD